ncbi:MAG: protein-disulfide reductase DsbD domain-containing protein [Thermodesulfobacteriota bacterium]
MRRRLGLAGAALLAALVLVGGSAAMARAQGGVVQGRVVLAPGEYTAPSGTFGLTLQLIIAHNMHINGPQAGRAGLIPTEVRFLAPAGVDIDRVRFPAPQRVKVSFSPQPIEVYSDRLEITASVRIGPRVRPGILNLVAQVSYQACDNNVCHMPQTLELPFTLAVVAKP